MLRKIINIDIEKCNGCGICATACHEGAIGIINGKATLLRDDYCDGLGDCIPTCPVDAIHFIEREAEAYNEAEVLKNQEQKELLCGCPGSNSSKIQRAKVPKTASCEINSCLSQWPVQIKLAPINAPYFENANLLIAADCTAYAYGNFHNEFIKNRITLIGCPKLDATDYTDKLTEIIKGNAIKSVTIVRMEVPCCGGIESFAKEAIKNSDKFIPWQVVTISVKGEIIS